MLAWNKTQNPVVEMDFLLLFDIFILYLLHMSIPDSRVVVHVPGVTVLYAIAEFKIMPSQMRKRFARIKRKLSSETFQKKLNRIHIAL